MDDNLTEDTLAPHVLIRYEATSAVDLLGGTERPTVAVRTGAVWARAEHDSIGLELRYGALGILLRSGTLLVDARAGTGLIIVLRGEAEVSSQGRPVHFARAGEALSFDSGARVGAPAPIDAPELARDTFVSLNLVLDALSGVEIRLLDQTAVVDDDADASEDVDEASTDDPSTDTTGDDVTADGPRPLPTDRARAEAKRLRGRRA